MRRILLACLFFAASVVQTHAVSVTILTAPTSIGEDKFNVTVKVEGASPGTNYLRVDLYSEGVKNYFGETDNGQAWYNGSDGKQYFPITILSGTPSIATISARLGEPTMADYPGPGMYKLRIRRYTSSGNQGSEDPVPVAITLTKSWPSPSPSVSPAPSPTQTPTPVAVPTISASPTPPPTPKPMTPSLKPSPAPSIIASPEGVVAGETTEVDLSIFGVSPSPTLSASTLRESESKPTLNHARFKTVVVIGVGLLLTAFAGFFLYRRIMRQ